MGLARQAKTTPTLLSIEDLQWVDPSSLALIHYIGRNTKDSGLLILGTYRPEDVAVEDGKGHPLIGTMQQMGREDLLEKMELPRLPEESIDEFLASMLQKIDFTDEFKKQIYKETEGNPLFVIELIKFLVDENVIQNIDGTWKLAKPLEEGTIPSKVLSVISRRLDRVENEDRKTLDYASVIGEMFDSTLLADILEMDRVQLLERLRYIEKTHRLIHPQNGNFKFDHAKIKEALYNEIPQELKNEYHLKAAKSLETLNKDDLDEVIGDLAFHFYQSKNKDKALLYLDKAAEKAKKDYSNEEAIRFYRDAIELEEEDQKRMEIFEGMGDIYHGIGEYNKSMKSYSSALELTEGKRKIAEIKTKIGRNYSRKGENDECLKVCTEALKLVKDENCEEEALAINYIGGVYMHLGGFDKAMDQFKKSLEIREKIGNQDGIAQCLYNTGILIYDRGEYEKALEHFEKSLELWRKTGYQQGIGVSTSNIGAMYGYMGEYDKALEHFEKSLGIFEKIGSRRSLDETYILIAEVYIKKKDLKRSLDFCKRAFELSKEIGLKERIASSKKIFGMIFKEEKKWKESIESFEDSVKILKEMGREKELAESHYEFGLMWKAKGEPEKAKVHLNKALDIFEKLKLEKWVEKMKLELEAL
jgi:tetratricopeptide (TPR) repeat protein